MNTNDIRKAFLEFFSQGSHDLPHMILPSASLVPFNDATLLFTNAGMVPLKNYFLGIEKPPCNRLTSVQRCVRAGGKHNDLTQVGHTTRHHTFFEMLGNFSIGNYFKEQAIRFAWTFLTEILGLPKNKLWVTVYKEDKKAADFWLKKIKINPNYLSYCDKNSNFWMMGDVGPCGPCSEIFYDHGSHLSGGPPGSKDENKGRFVEIWNLVFMQYNADATGQLLPLPRPSIDTGMGLERIAAVMQGVYDNYDIDIFQQLLNRLSAIVSCKDFKNPAMRIIADHIRSTVFLIADGIHPSNEGRGYVLRRIMRRAIRQGYGLRMREPFLYKLVGSLIDVMRGAYPELIPQRMSIEHIILQEEKLFSGTLAQGMKIFEQAVESLSGRVIPGDVVFYLYDTYGFPKDLTEDMAKDHGLSVDQAGFDRAMKKQQEQSKQAHAFTQERLDITVDTLTEFLGYDSLEQSAKVIALYAGKSAVTQLKPGKKGIVILDRTPFYAEAGGQIGDAGLLSCSKGSFQVENTQKIGQTYLHVGKVLEGSLEVSDLVTATVDKKRRLIARNHTATHLLHSALQKMFGEKVVQKGSLVSATHLRFDFAFSRTLTQKEIFSVEQWVNEKIRENIPLKICLCDLEDAKQRGAKALFSEKYAQEVRVVDINGCSLELCGGTHVERTGDIGLFKIISEGAIAAGIRRIDALTAEAALVQTQSNESELKRLMRELKTDQKGLPLKISQLLSNSREMQKQMAQHQQKHASKLYNDLKSQVETMNGVSILVAKLEGVKVNTLRKLVDQFKEKLEPCCVVLTTSNQKSVQAIVGVSKTLTERISALEILTLLTQQIEGKGGGRADLAQGGGTNVAALSSALDGIKKYLKEKH